MSPLRRLCLLALLPAAAAPGCHRGGGSAAPAAVAGRLVLPGSPADLSRLEGGRVLFRSAADPARAAAAAVIDHDGTFAADPGPPGEYLVRVLPPADSPGEYRTPPFDPRYCDFKTSGLRVTVPASSDLVLELTKPPRR